MTQFKSMRLRKGLRFGIICILIHISQTCAAQTLNLYDAVNKTLTNYPAIKQRQAEVALGKAHINTVNAYRLPSLKVMDEINAGTSNSLPGDYFPLGSIPSTSGSIRSTNKYDVTSGNIALSYLDWPLYTFGYYNAIKKDAQAALATTQAELTSDEYLLSQNVVSLYLDWLKKYRLLQIETENLDRAQTILNAITATVRSGLKPGVDSSTAIAEYSKDRISYLQALNSYTADRISIAMYTGMDTTRIVPDTSITQNLVLRTNIIPTDSISISHPLLNVYQKQYQQQLTENKAIARQYMPKFSLEGAGWMRGSSISNNDIYASDLSKGLAYSRYNYLFGLSLSYNLFDLKHRHDEIVEGKYLAKAKQEALYNQQLSLNATLQQVNASYTNTLDKLKELPNALRSSQMAYTQQMALYRSGLNTLIDVTNALYVLKQTETDVVLTQDDLLQLLYMRAGLSNQLDLFLQHFKQ